MRAFTVRFHGVATHYPTVKNWRTGQLVPAWGEQHYIAEGGTPDDVVKDGVAKGYYLDYASKSIKAVELVKRYRLFIDDHLFDSSTGRFSYASKEEAEARAEAFRDSESARNYYGDRLNTLEVREHWCYPNHFDPAPLRING